MVDCRMWPLRLIIPLLYQTSLKSKAIRFSSFRDSFTALSVHICPCLDLSCLYMSSNHSWFPGFYNFKGLETETVMQVSYVFPFTIRLPHFRHQPKWGASGFPSCWVLRLSFFSEARTSYSGGLHHSSLTPLSAIVWFNLFSEIKLSLLLLKRFRAYF